MLVHTAKKVPSSGANRGLRESVLRDFLLARVSASELASEVSGAMVPAGEHVTHHPIVDMDEDCEVTAEHLLRVCDAVLEGSLRPECLAAIGFCVIASDHFIWGTETAAGEVVAETLHDWSAPEINYPLTMENAAAFRSRLLGEPSRLRR